MRIKASSWFPILLLLIMAVAIGISSTFAFWESWLLPIIVAGFIFVLAAVQIYRELSAKERVTTVAGEEPAEVKGAGFGSVLGWVLGLPLAIYLLGFIMATPLFLLCYLKLRRHSWAVSIATAALTTVAIYGIFELGLESDLWKGLFFE